VPKHSATTARETVVAMDASHWNICKFRDPEDSLYMKVKKGLDDLVGPAPAVVKARMHYIQGNALLPIGVVWTAEKDHILQIT
jgi:hypothetical protein